MKNFVPFIILSIIIALIAISTFKLSHENNEQLIAESDEKEQNYNFVKTKIKLKDFSLNNLYDDKKKLDESSFNKGYVIINFFASWCSTCIVEHPLLFSLKHKNIKKIYGIAWRDINENTKHFLDKFKNPYDEVYVDSRNQLGEILDLKAIPITLIVKDGVVIYKYEGNLQEFHLEEISKIVSS